MMQVMTACDGNDKKMKFDNNRSGSIRRITVFCSSRDCYSEEMARLIRKIAHYLTDNGIDLVYGGAKSGIMGLLTDNVLESGGSVTGVLPPKKTNFEKVHTGLTKSITAGSLSERKEMMIAKADAVLVLPGGIGTMDEFFEVLVMVNSFQLITIPVAVLNCQGFYDHIFSWMDQCTEKNMMAPASEMFAILKTFDDFCRWMGAASETLNLNSSPDLLI